MKLLKSFLYLFVMAILLSTMVEINDGNNCKSDIKYISYKIYAKGKPKRIKKKTLRDNYECLGKYELTAYCGCSICCGFYSGGKTATGVKAKANRTIAVDPKVIPYGSKVIINKKEYVAEDCGGAIKGKRIDVYFDSHSEALEFGRKTVYVYKKKPPKLISKIKNVKLNKKILKLARR